MPPRDLPAIGDHALELLALENLTRTYGSFVALEAAQVVLEKGVVGLLGPNGAGKSTLLKVLLGLLEPTSGKARLLGLDVRTQALEIRSRIGYLSEAESFVPGIPAVEFVALAGEVTGMPRRDAHRRAHEVLSYLGVEETRYRTIESLPTGVKQRIQLAQALVHDPELLILDEPTNGLDPAGRRAMLGLIRSLHRDFGKSIILSSHLLDDVDLVCQSMLVLDRGRVLAHGRIDVLRAHRQNRYRLELSGDTACFLQRLRAQGVHVDEMPRLGGGTAVIAVEAPVGFETSRFFELLCELGEENPVDAPLLRGLVPDEEKLSDLFARLVSSGDATRLGREASIVGEAS